MIFPAPTKSCWNVLLGQRIPFRIVQAPQAQPREGAGRGGGGGLDHRRGGAEFVFWGGVANPMFSPYRVRRIISCSEML